MICCYFIVLTFKLKKRRNRSDAKIWKILLKFHAAIGVFIGQFQFPVCTLQTNKKSHAIIINRSQVLVLRSLADGKTDRQAYIFAWYLHLMIRKKNFRFLEIFDYFINRIKIVRTIC